MTAATLVTLLAMIASVALALYLVTDANRQAWQARRSLSAVQDRIGALELRVQADDDQRAIWDALPVGIVLLDAEERVRVCNRRAREILASPSLPARGATSLGSVTDNQEIRRCVQQATRQRGTVTAALTLAPGVFVDLIAHALEGGAVLVVLQDVSELRLLRTVRRDFVANVSHELRTPLASIRLLVDTLEDGALDEIEVAGNFVHRIGVEADHLIQMVTELLELSRIESGQLPIRREPIDVADVVEQAVERLTVVALDKDIFATVDLEPDLPSIMADHDQIIQVLMNLLFNAIKFTARGGSVLVSARQQDGMIVFAVSDSGVGIAREDLARIFERFYKSDKSRSRSGGGTGLGLPIARHIVEAHGGNIRAESVEGQGSTFTFTLPVA